MPDLLLGVTLSRTLLGLPALALNDHVNYYVGPQLLGGQVQWTRQQATSPFLDGSVTVQRSRQQVTEQITVEVLGDTQAELQANMAALIAAAIQDHYVLTVSVNGTVYSYSCEAADYAVVWVGTRFMATQGQLTLSIPRFPVPLAGAV